MTTKILGKVAITPKGEYSNATTYQSLDLITYNGGSYLALKETTGNLPTNNEYWQLIAEKGKDGEKGEQGIQGVQGIQGEKGEKGDTGEKGQDGTNGTNGKDGNDGYTPVKGTDYYTEADKQEMVNLVLNALPSAEGVEF